MRNPDPACYLNADPGQRSQTNADPGQTFKSQKVEVYEKNRILQVGQKTFYEVTKAFEASLRKPGYSKHPNVCLLA
jgi:hypothetical protein